MELTEILESLKNCPCGREHRTDIEKIIVESGLVGRVGEILLGNHFPSDILLVADKNTLKASEGIVESLENAGFKLKMKIFEDLRVADIADSEEIGKLSADVGGILSVGTGSNNDICRLAAYQENKDFCIFATAPSMDGFASDTSPITTNNFKQSLQAKQPRLIIADTKILAQSPKVLKGAGFGDMLAKYLAVTDWKIANLLIGEYFCEKVCELTREAVRKICALSDRVAENDEGAAGAVFEALILTGIGMGFTGNSRPASSSEHILSHFWECKKLESGLLSDFHGRKVGVATLEIAKIYHKLAEKEEIYPVKENIDWNTVYNIYGENLSREVKKVTESSFINDFEPEKLRENWGKIRSIIKEELPSCEELESLLIKCGAATAIDEIDMSPELYAKGLRYHMFMRNRLTLMRLLPAISPGMFEGDGELWKNL